MAEILNMPKLGFDMAEGTLMRWVKGVGDEIESGEVLAEIETDKATVEVESQASGVILHQVAEEGTIVAVGKPIAVIGEQGEQFDLEQLAAADEAKEPAVEGEEGAPEPAAAEREPTEAPAPPGDGRLPAGVKASPVARRVAEEMNVNLRSIAGSGPGGRIVKKDVQEAAERGAPAPAAGGGLGISLPTEPMKTERIPVSRLRRAIGQRMTHAKQELPHFYLTAEVDAGPMMEMRRQANEMLPEEEKLSVNDFIVKATALALRQFPNLNASLEGDEIVRHGQVNVGVAVAVEGGLMTVVVHEADRKPLRAISQETREKAARAREGRVRPDDVEGSTLTVSNLGMFDIDHFIAIINPPEAAILATGSVRKVPVVVDDRIEIGHRLEVTLSADHRVTDGAEAARWLQHFRQMIESPLRLAV